MSEQTTSTDKVFFPGAHIVPLLSVLVILGSAVYSILAPTPQIPALDSYLGERISLEGVIIEDPDKREDTMHLTIRVDTVNAKVISKRAKILVIEDRFTEARYGDRVRVSGVVKRPESFETETGRTFEYRKYLLASGITHVISFGNLKILSQGEGNPVIGALLSLKHLMLSGIQASVPEPESALLAGLLLGEKQSLGVPITDAFRKAGVIHIIVLSGYNVSLVVNAILFVALSFLKREYALSIASISILAFAIMTGASETTIRASAMALIVLLAKYLNRPADGIRILLMVAAGMALWSPYLVLYDLSYQLSILATLGLILFSDPIAKKLTHVSETLGFREILATTLGTQFTVLPILVISVGQISLISILTNILVLQAVPLAMLTGFAASLVALISAGLAFPFSAIAYAILHYIIAVSVWFGSLPFSAIQIRPEWMWTAMTIVVALYGVFAILYFRKKFSLKSIR